MRRKVLKVVMLVIFVFANSCERESTCETETDCYSDGNGGQTCIERPIPGTCIDNNFGF